MLAVTQLLISSHACVVSSHCHTKDHLDSNSCGKYQFNVPFILVASGCNGCALVVSWDVKNSRPDLMEGDTAVKHHRAAMPLNKTQMQGRMHCSGKWKKM